MQTEFNDTKLRSVAGKELPVLQFVVPKLPRRMAFAGSAYRKRTGVVVPFG